MSPFDAALPHCPPSVRYQFIKEQQEQFSLSALCRAMQVGRSGFYAWRKRPKSERQIQNEILTEQIQAAYEESDQTYGSPRLYAELKEAGISCSQKRIARLMRLAKISALRPKRFVVTTDSGGSPLRKRCFLRKACLPYRPFPCCQVVRAGAQ